MPLVEKRYAEAIVNMSVQAGATEAFREELENVVHIYKEQTDLRFLLSNPEMGIEAKKDTIRKLFTVHLRTELLNLLLLLIDKGRIKFLPGIFEEFVAMADKRKNVLGMTIISVDPLEDSQINLIKEKFKVMFKASEVKVSTQLDKTKIGGVQVKIGDKLYDGTVKGRLEGLKEFILKS
jgi:F-type H+-transporting ATPase subunit delta